MGVYRFPAMAKLDDYEREEQMQYILGEWTEANEALQALSDCHTVMEFHRKRKAYGMELLDIIHSAETALRMEFTEEEVEELRAKVIDKNARRGYYKVTS